MTANKNGGCPETRTIQLTKGAVTIVDAADYERLAERNWYLTSAGYAARGGGRRGAPQSLMHREILGCQPHEVVDHINGDTLDNRRENLRACTPSQNSRNTRPRPGSYKGVWRPKNRPTFRAAIKIDGKTRHLGAFATAEEAARAYDAAAREMYGEFAWLNFRDENGRAPTEVRATPDGLDAVQGIASTAPESNPPLPTLAPFAKVTYVDARDWMRQMGASPDTTDPLAALREAEGYVVAEVVGDVGGQTTPPVRYKGSWIIGLAGWHV